MRIKHLFIILTALLSFTIFAFNNPREVDADFFKHSSSVSVLGALVLSMEEARFDKRKDSIYSNLLVYNKDAVKTTAINILNAIEAFHLDETKQMYEYSLFQLLYESRGIHMNGGSLLKSSAGALGICQIKSTTAFHYLKLVMGEDDMDFLSSLGAAPISFTVNDKVSKVVNGDGKAIWITPVKTKKKVAKWMENEKNSTLLWGFIMRRNTDKYGHINALVIYNTGKGTWGKLRKSGFNMNSHSYLRGIRKVEKVLNN